ncbi:hypothetical protein K501DRAFT_331334 [Backusella circina FSU 941]|nr:hypothetical protein K501DRAFT_331334 [Backusella circina FSU 941]
MAYRQRLPLLVVQCRHFHSSRLVLNNRPKEYELRVGYAIASLQDDLPHFFQQGLTEHDIYSPDIVLSDPHYTKLSIHGRTAYLSMAQMLRWSTSLYFDDITVEITKMRVIPENEPDDDPSSLSSMEDHFSTVREAERDAKERGIVKRLEVRWKMQGIKQATFWNSSGTTRHIEGVFLYRFDHEGYIGEHRIQRIVPPPSRRVVLLHSFGVRLRSLLWDNKRTPVLNPGF